MVGWLLQRDGVDLADVCCGVEDWDDKRRKEGDLEVEETDEMRKRELEYKKKHPDQPKGNVLR